MGLTLKIVNAPLLLVVAALFVAAPVQAQKAVKPDVLAKAADAESRGDYALAIKEYGKAAGQGHLGAKFALATLYLGNHLVEKDMDRAMKLFDEDARPAAEAWIKRQKDPSKLSIIHRMGQSTKCEKYCSVARFCPYGRTRWLGANPELAQEELPGVTPETELHYPTDPSDSVSRPA